MTKSSPPAPVSRIGNNLTGAIQVGLSAGLTRLQEFQPEGPFTRGMQALRPEIRLGMVPLLALTNAFGLLLVSISYILSVSEYSYPIVEACCLGGLVLMIVPNLVRFLSRVPTRLERICLTCILVGCCYFVELMISPLHSSSFDGFNHWRTADDILRTGHLFSENAMLPVSPYYPGLEIVTNAISTTTGLNSFYAGIIAIAASRPLMALALFLFQEQITGSSRMASIAIVIYITNPHFLFFDNSYSYESQALPLAILMIYILERYSNVDISHRRVIGSAWIVLMAITITHHMTDYFFDGLLLLWAAVSFFLSVSRSTRVYLATIAVCGLVFALGYAFLLPGNPVWSYLSAYFGTAFKQIGQIITGSSAPRTLFTTAGSAQTMPIWDRLFVTTSVIEVILLLPFGLLILLRQQRNNALAITFGITALLYPLIQAFRFVSAGVEITDRAAAFLFLSIAYILTLLITHFWPTYRLNRRNITLITGMVTVLFIGGVIAGSGPYLSTTPGPYAVIADSRSIEPQGMEVATWSFAYLGENNRVATDRINQLLMSTYGHQRIVDSSDDNVEVWPLFYSAQFDSTDIATLQKGKIHFLVVDIRISTTLPLEGSYFDTDKPSSIIKRGALTKFNRVRQINRLFDSGDIVIFDTGAFVNGRFGQTLQKP